ncbi:UNVERIFIED_CONTAM: Arrestin red cell isoform 1 [Trichonephila clavipes]
MFTVVLPTGVIGVENQFSSQTAFSQENDEIKAFVKSQRDDQFTLDVKITSLLVVSLIISDATQKENLGIIVQYKVKVKLCLGPLLGGDLVAELPFILMHPKPVDDPPPIPAPNAGTVTNAENGDNVGIDTDLIRLDTYFVLSQSSETWHQISYPDCFQMPLHSYLQNYHLGGQPILTVPVKPLDAGLDDGDDDLIFEDFARLRLRGETDA